MNPRSLTQAVLLGLCCANSVVAQQFGPPGPDYLPTGDFPTPIGVVDLDGDGAPDLIDSTPAVWRNDGTGRIAAPSAFGSTFHAYDFVAADYDGDGRTDLLWFGAGSTPLLQLQRASGVTEVLASQMLYASDLVPGDVDGDGDVDLLYVSQLASQAGIYLYEPGGRFVHTPGAGVPASHRWLDNPSAGDLADLDGDGDLDLLLVQPDRVESWSNDGRGRFTETQDLRLSSWSVGPLRCGDLDGDGDLDAVLVSHSSEITVLVNDGAGRLALRAAGAPSRNRAPSDVDLLDIDGDGDLDLAIAQDDLVVYRNDGTGRFGTVDVLLTGWQAGRTASFADFDRDGRADLFVDRGPALYLQSATGAFVRAGGAIPRTTGRPTLYLRADFDGDGDVDLFNNAGGRGQLLFGDGRGQFRDRSDRLPNNHVRMLGIAASDLDGDGDVDLVTGSQHGATRVLINDGTGRFRERRPALGSDIVPAIAIGDLDGDRQPDIVMLGLFQGPELWLNRLPLDFTRSTGALPVDLRAAVDVEAADLDNDGDRDLLFGFPASSHPPMPGRVRRFDNDGTGRFRERVDFPVVGTGPVDTFDFDRDGDLDVVAGNRVWINDGAGNFTAAPVARIPALPMDERAPALADIDGDGHVDILTSAADGRALHNDGNGGFRDVTANWMTSSFAGATIALATDVDGDGDADLVIVGEYGDRIWTSRTRDVRVLGPAIGGQDLRLEIAAHGRRGAVAWLAFSVGVDTPRVVPGLGTLRLDPANLIPGIALPLPTDQPAIVNLTIPTDPALVGMRLDTQALIGSSPADVRLSNAAATVVLR